MRVARADSGVISAEAGETARAAPARADNVAMVRFITTPCGAAEPANGGPSSCNLCTARQSPERALLRTGWAFIRKAGMDWNNLKYFLAFAEAGSLSRASEKLRVDHST